MRMNRLRQKRESIGTRAFWRRLGIIDSNEAFTE